MYVNYFSNEIKNIGLSNTGYFINNGSINFNVNNDKAQTEHEKTAQNVQPVAKTTIARNPLNHSHKKKRSEDNSSMPPSTKKDYIWHSGNKKSKDYIWHTSNEKSYETKKKRSTDSAQNLTESPPKKNKKMSEDTEKKVNFDSHAFKRPMRGVPITDKSKKVSQMNQQPQSDSKMSVSHLCSNTTSTIPSMDEWFKSIN